MEDGFLMKELLLRDLKNITGGKKFVFDIIDDAWGGWIISMTFYEDDNVSWEFCMVPGHFASIADAQNAIMIMVNNRNQEYEGADVIVNVKNNP